MLLNFCIFFHVPNWYHIMFNVISSVGTSLEKSTSGREKSFSILNDFPQQSFWNALFG